MTNMVIKDLKRPIFIKILDFQMQIIFLDIFLGIIHFKMMKMMIFSVVFLGKSRKKQILKDLVFLDLVLEVLVQVCLKLNHYLKMMIFSQALVVEVIFLLLDQPLLETKIQIDTLDLQSQLVQPREHCNIKFYHRNGKTVTTKKTTIVNQDGTK